MANVTGVTKHFAVAKEGFTTTTSATIAPAATTVPLNSVTGYSNGDVVVLVIDGDDIAKKQVFTGTVDTTGVQITNVVWTEGSNTTHTAGASVVDYVAATHQGMTTKGLLVSHDQDGTLKTSAVEAALGINTTASWNPLLSVPDTVTYNGNRSYSLVFNNTNLTDTVTPGMRLRTTRTVTAPTQCTDLEASSSQYWNDTSVSGHSFTDDFVAGAWVKLESYTAGDIIARWNGTSGWRLNVTSDGRVQLIGYNASSSNFKLVISYQSLPLNKWVYVAVQLDMSAAGAGTGMSTTTNYVMIDGVDVPCVTSQGGTNPTALVQAGDLNVGAANSTSYFDGKIAQAFVSSAKITQANVRTLISQGLTASLISTHSIASAYSFDGNANDLNTTNANNLTAQGSATATNADSPFSDGANLASGYTDGTTDFGVVMTSSFSTNTTLVVQVPEGCTIPTSGGVSAIYYSSLDTPYGFPSAKAKWVVRTIIKTPTVQNSPTALTWYNLGAIRLTVPIGSWKYGYQATPYAYKPTNAIEVGITLATSSSSETDPIMTSIIAGYQEASTRKSVSDFIVLTSATDYYLNLRTATSSATNVQLIEGSLYGAGVVFAECAYV